MIGYRIEQARLKAGMTRAELGRACGMSDKVIGFYEREDRSPDPDKLRRLCRALNVSADYLIGLADQPDVPEMNRKFSPGQIRDFEKISKATSTIAAMDEAAPFTRDCLPVVSELVEDLLELQAITDLIYEDVREKYPAFEISDLTTEEDRRRLRINEQLNDPKAIEFIAGEKAFEERIRIKIEETAIGIVDLLAVDLFNILRDKEGADVPILCRIVKTGNKSSK